MKKITPNYTKILVDDYQYSHGLIMHILQVSDQSIERWYAGKRPHGFLVNRLKRMVESEQRKAERDKEKSK